MPGVFIALSVVAAVAVLIALYKVSAAHSHSEQIRTNEVFRLRTRDLWVLRVCRYRKSEMPGEPVLLVHGMGANQNNFTFPPGGCLVDYLSAKGYDCWTVDLRGSRSSEPPFGHTRDEVRMEDFFTEDLPMVIRHILETTLHTKVHWIGHSMGGMLLYAFVQAHGGNLLASGTTLGSPIDFSDAAGKVPVRLLTFGERHPSLAGKLIRGAIPLMKLLHLAQIVFPVNVRNIPQNMTSSHFVTMIENPLPGLMRQVRYWIQNKEYKLFDGHMDVAQGLSDFSIPLLAFYAAVDPFINAQRALEYFNTIKSKDKQAILCSKEKGFVEDYSHCDLAFGKKAATEIFVPISKWLEAHPCTPPLARQKASAAPVPEQIPPVHSGRISQKEETVVALERKPKPVTAKKVAPKVPTKSKATPKKAVKKETPAPTIAPPTKAAPSKKKPAIAKKNVVAKPPAKKKAAALKAPARAVNQSVLNEALEISPEALARAASIRAARNQTLSEIESLLNRESKNTNK